MKVSMTYISRSSIFVLYPEEFSWFRDFALYREEEFMYKHHIF